MTVRKILAFCLMILAMFIFFRLYFNVIPVSPDSLSDYYLTNFIEDTGARNAVTAIYLNYRVFDTLFETLTLLVSVLAIIHFSRHEGEKHE